MRIFLAVIATLIITISPVFAVITGYIIAPSSGSTPTYLLSEDFTGTSLPSGWTLGGGTPTYDSAGIHLPSVANATTTWVYKTISSGSEVWAYMKYTPTANTITVNGYKSLLFLKNGTSIQLALAAQSSAGTGSPVKIRITMGSAQISTVGTLSLDTEYQIVVHYKKGTGSNGIADVAFVSGTGSFPASGDNFASLSTGTTTLDINRYDIYVEYSSGTGTSAIVNKVRVDDAAINSNPI